jgi:hypothetical protein
VERKSVYDRVKLHGPTGRRSRLPQIEEMQGRLTALAAEDGLDYHLDRGRFVNTFEAS